MLRSEEAFERPFEVAAPARAATRLASHKPSLAIVVGTACKTIIRTIPKEPIASPRPLCKIHGAGAAAVQIARLRHPSARAKDDLEHLQLARLKQVRVPGVRLALF